MPILYVFVDVLVGVAGFVLSSVLEPVQEASEAIMRTAIMRANIFLMFFMMKDPFLILILYFFFDDVGLRFAIVC